MQFPQESLSIARSIFFDRRSRALRVKTPQILSLVKKGFSAKRVAGNLEGVTEKNVWVAVRRENRAGRFIKRPSFYKRLLVRLANPPERLSLRQRVLRMVNYHFLVNHRELFIGVRDACKEADWSVLPQYNFDLVCERLREQGVAVGLTDDRTRSKKLRYGFLLRQDLDKALVILKGMSPGRLERSPKPIRDLADKLLRPPDSFEERQRLLDSLTEGRYKLLKGVFLTATGLFEKLEIKKPKKRYKEVMALLRSEGFCVGDTKDGRLTIYFLLPYDVEKIMQDREKVRRLILGL